MIIINGIYYLFLFIGTVVTIAGGLILCFDILSRIMTTILKKNLQTWYLFIEFLRYRKDFKHWYDQGGRYFSSDSK